MSDAIGRKADIAAESAAAATTPFTAGPWTFRTGSGYGFYVEGPLEKEEGKWLLAEVCGRMKQNRANARLISAAPDLLAALEDLIMWCPADSDTTGPFWKANERARAAIKKARGL